MPRATTRHSRIASPLHQPGDAPVHAMSCAELATQLPRLWGQEEQLIIKGMRMRPSTSGYRVLAQERANVLTRIGATEDLILATPAATLADAAAQMLLAASQLNSGLVEPDAMDNRAIAALFNAFKVVANAAGLKPADLAAEAYGMPQDDDL